MKTIRTLTLITIAFALITTAVAIGVYVGNRAASTLGATATNPDPLCISLYLSPEFASTPRATFMTDCAYLLQTITAAPTLDMDLIRRRAACSVYEKGATYDPAPYNTCMGTPSPGGGN